MEKNIIYFGIGSTAEPKITGDSTGVCQAEFYINKKECFVNEEEQKYFRDYYAKYNKSITFENFEKHDNKKLTKLIMRTRHSKIKPTDFLDFAMYDTRFVCDTMLVSDKLYKLLGSFSLSEHIHIPCDVIHKNEKLSYHFLLFPMIANEYIIFEKSAFYSLEYSMKKNCFIPILLEQVYSIDEYTKAILLKNRINVLCLKKHFEYDILYSGSFGYFLSPKLLKALDENSVTNYRIEKSKVFFFDNDMEEYVFKYPSRFSLEKYNKEHEITLYPFKGYEGEGEKMLFGSVKIAPKSEKEIIDSGIGVSNAWYFEDTAKQTGAHSNYKLRYIEISKQKDGINVMLDGISIFSENALMELKQKYEYVYSKNKMKIFFPEVFLMLSHFEKKKYEDKKKVLLFDKKIEDYIYEKILKIERKEKNKT